MLAGLATHATSQVGGEVTKHLSQGPAAAPRRLCGLLSSARPLCCLTSHVFSCSSLHMARVSFARSHLYFDSLPLMTHFFCLTLSCPHSYQRLLQSARRPVSSRGVKKKKRTMKKRKNKWDCYISRELEQKFRPPPSQQRCGPRFRSG